MVKYFKKLKNKSFWQQGSGELLGFVCILPFIVMLICFIISSAQVSVINQKLSYTAYNCCRAAVVSETEVIAQDRAESVYTETFGALSNSYTSCQIDLLDGANWGKGSYIKCTVRYDIDVLMPFTSGIREQSIVMMIENG